MVISMEEYRTFIFYGSIRASVEALDEESGNKLLRAVMIYGTEGVVPETDSVTLAILLSIIPNIDYCNKRWNKSPNVQKDKTESEDSWETNLGEGMALMYPNPLILKRR